MSAQKKGLKIVSRAVADLVPYARNARTHSDEQVEAIAAAIREFGFTNPILIDERNGLIAGHGRVLAAISLQMDKVPCIVLADLTEAQKRAYILADNRLAEKAGWDEELLKLELTDLAELGVDLDLIGFEALEAGAAPPAGRDTSPQVGADLQYRLVVDCADEGAQANLLERLEAEGFKCRPLIS